MALAFVNFYFWTILIVLKHVHFESQRLDMTYLRQCNVCFQYLTLAIDLPAHWIRELCGCASHRSKGAGGSVADGDQGGRGGHPVVHQPPLSSVSLNFLFLLLLHISHCALDKYVNEWSTTAKRRWTHLLWSWLNLVHPFLALAPTCCNCFKVTLFSPFFTFYQDMGCSCCHKAKRWRGLGARGCWRRHEEQFRAEGDIFKVWWNQKLVGGGGVVVVVVVVVGGTVILFWDANDTHWRKPAWVLTSSSALISATPRRRQMARTPLGDVPNMMIPDKWDVSRHLTAPAVVGEWYQGTEQESFKGSSKISPWKVLAIWRTQVIILVLFIASWAMSWAHNATKCPICSMVCNSEEEKKTQILETMWVGIVYAHRHMTTINFPLTWINNRDYLQNHSWEMVTSLQANSQMMGSWKLGNPPPLAACSLVHMVPKQGCLSLFPYTTDSKVWHTDVRSTDIFQAWEGTPPCKKTFILQILISAFLKKKIYLVSQTHKLKCNVDSTLWRVIFEVWD